MCRQVAPSCWPPGVQTRDGEPTPSWGLRAEGCAQAAKAREVAADVLAHVPLEGPCHAQSHRPA